MFGCKDASKERAVAKDSAEVNLSADTAQAFISKDSEPYYWEKLPVRTVADLILTDSIRPVTSSVISQMLDSLSSGSKQTRHLYFRVFNKVMNKADGELAESIGGYALTYVQNYPKEFLENSQTFSNNQLAAWAGNIGIELFLKTGENVKEAFDEVVVLLNDNCINCNNNYRSRLKQFNNMIWQTIEENRGEKR